jgi:hypothetical protein
VDKSQVRLAIELLEHLGGDLARLAEIDEEDRRRLVIAAGQISRAGVPHPAAAARDAAARAAARR